jgi:O-antigen ligase
MLENNKLYPLLQINFLFCLLLASVSSSFVLFTLTGLLFRFSVISAIVLWLGVKIKNNDYSFAFLSNKVLLAFIALCLYQLLSIYTSIVPDNGFTFIQERFWLVCILIIFCDLITDKAFERNLHITLQFIIFCTIFYGFYQIYIGMPALQESLDFSPKTFMEERFAVRLNSSEMFSTYAHANLFSLICALLLIYSFLLKTVIWYKAVLIVFCTAGIFYSASRGALVCLLLTAMLFAVIHFIKKRAYSKIVIGSAVLIIGAYFLKDYLVKVFYDSAFIRLGYWQSTWSMIAENPMGVGLANFKEHYFKFMSPLATEVKMAHNDHLQQLAEIGWIGFIFYVLFHVLIFKQCFNFSKNKEEKENLEKTSKNNAFLYASVIFFIFMVFSCLLIQWGAYDLPKYGFLFLFMLLILAFCLNRVYPHLKVEAKHHLGIMLLGIYFILHSSIDFAFYDHYLYLLFLILIFSNIKCKSINVTKSGFLLFSFILFALSMFSFIKYRDKYQGNVLIEVAQNKKDIIECYEYVLKHKESVYLWEALLSKIRGLEKEESIQASGIYVKVLNHCSDLRPNSANLAYNRGIMCEDPNLAHQYFKQAKNVYPLHPKYTYAYAESLDKMGNSKEALIWYKKALKRHHFAYKISKKQWDFKLILLQPDQLEKANRVLF